MINVIVKVQEVPYDSLHVRTLYRVINTNGDNTFVVGDIVMLSASHLLLMRTMEFYPRNYLRNIAKGHFVKLLPHETVTLSNEN